MVELFNNGGWAMWPLLVLLIFGIAVTIERMVTLSRAAIDANEFFQNLENALRSGGPERAAELCAETRGPVASAHPRRGRHCDCPVLRMVDCGRGHPARGSGTDGRDDG